MHENLGTITKYNHALPTCLVKERGEQVGAKGELAKHGHYFLSQGLANGSAKQKDSMCFLWDFYNSWSSK